MTNDEFLVRELLYGAVRADTSEGTALVSESTIGAVTVRDILMHIRARLRRAGSPSFVHDAQQGRGVIEIDPGLKPSSANVGILAGALFLDRFASARAIDAR